MNDFVRIKLFAACYKCKKEIEGNGTPEEGWFNPYYVKQDGGYLQTQLCPNCAPKLSLFMFCRRHPTWRWLNFLYAHLNSYFWLPCGVCGEYFGGHEKRGKGIKLNEYTTQGTCRHC